ncbi:type I restriction modification DNA specificity protein [Prochlorothrix hollandica PCC 9006 = CALU 1027]|uniref:Type I restriction modification DNA specificity protein n=2 Tax=Prochlorothrix hollandica TaxID=1223 RepID=A0A0M2PPM8_PROHO|nr:type I restriction modification DNA specificity protein [Prochlorothrix hollandica PCC 9006 = CALU 1027]
MVNYAFEPEYTPISPPDESEKLSTTIKLSEILNAGVRLEASAFSIEAHNAVTALENSGLQLIPLYGEGGLCQEAHNAFRFKRIYVKSEQGIPFLSSSDIISLRPETDRYLSRKYTRKLDILAVQKWDVLISRSGTIGNVSLANDAFTGKAVSEHVIRLSSNDPDLAGFIAAFLRSRYGRPQLTQATYGSVIVHIELEHLKRVQIPDLPPIRRIAIGRLMCKAGELRDEANRMLDEADQLLHERLDLPYLKSIAPSGNASAIAKIKASQLMGRLEGSFHDPVAIAAEKQLSKLAVQVTKVGDSRVTKEIRAITKFRKRTYVEKGGIPLLSSKQLFQIDPIDVKGLAKGAHTKDLPEIQLKENMIAVTCSGTIGRVQIIPFYMAKWTANQHATRFLAAEGMNAGYLYAWLASDYGYCLITRNSYGSVILEVDKEMFSSVPIPLPEPKIRDEIGNLVLKANQLRDEAWRNEQDAITRLESWIANKPIAPAQDESSPNKIPLKDIKYDPNAIPIWELAARISAKVPDEEWAKVPSDLSQRFDYYQGLRDDS